MPARYHIAMRQPKAAPKALHADVPDIACIGTSITFFRSPQHHPVPVDPYACRRVLFDKVGLFFHDSISQSHWPLYYHIVATCIRSNPYQWFELHRTVKIGGGGISHTVEMAALTCSILTDLMSAPLGFQLYLLSPQQSQNSISPKELER